MDADIAAALWPKTPGPMLRYAKFLPGLAATAEQIENYSAYWRAAAERALQSPDPVLVALGDSLAQGVGASAPEHGYVGRIRSELSAAGRPIPVLNLSQSGATIDDVLAIQLPALGKASVSAFVVVCTVGSNDLVRSARMSRTRRSMSRLLEQLPDQTVMATVPAKGSVLAKALNRHVRREADRLDVVLADVDTRLNTWRGNRAADWFHPNDAGYRIWAAAFAERLDSAIL